jgi:hypothetical protein
VRFCRLSTKPPRPVLETNPRAFESLKPIVDHDGDHDHRGTDRHHADQDGPDPQESLIGRRTNHGGDFDVKVALSQHRPF